GLVTSGGFLNDRLTPAVLFNPCVMLLLGPMGPMVSSDDCRGLTGIPVTQSTTQHCGLSVTLHSELYTPTGHTHTHTQSFNSWSHELTVHTSSDQSKLVFFIGNFLLLNISTREEKSHHPFEELVHEKYIYIFI
uniref:Uncharacterized protein n=1 Tax=Periophthalmus magnuspinnatus TaxID=409849 RepID=A0A3B4AHL0_9GOBI